MRFTQMTYTDVHTAYSEHILHFAYDSMKGSYDLPSAFDHVFECFRTFSGDDKPLDEKERTSGYRDD